MKSMLVSSLLVVGLAVGSGTAAFAQAGNSGSNAVSGAGYSMMGNGSSFSGRPTGYGYGMGPGMMGYGGYGMGPGMMGYGGYGMGPGMMGYGGYGMGPGMMGYGGYGMGSGMMGYGGYGMGSGMMGYGGYGMGSGMMGYGGYGRGPGMMGNGYGRRGGGYGYGMGPGMMGYSYGPNNSQGYGNRWNAWQRPEQTQKFLDQTVELRKKLNDEEFDYREALRNPSTSPQDLAKLEKEIVDLRNQISKKADSLH